MKTASFLLVSLLLFATVGFGPAASQPDRNSLAARFGQLPISFEMNQGQTDSQVQFLARGDGYNLFLTSQETVLRLIHRDNDCTPLDHLQYIQATYNGDGSYASSKRRAAVTQKSGLQKLVF